MSKSQIRRFLMSTKEAQDTKNILELFERITARKATPEEVAELEHRAKQPTPQQR